MDTVTKIRYAVVCKGANNAKYGSDARPEYYIHSWTEEVQEDTGEWESSDWKRFQDAQDEELASCEAEVANV